MTLISAPPSARTASTGLTAASNPAEAGAFASVLEGVLQADASRPASPDAAAGDQDLSASAPAPALMAWPTGQAIPNAESGSAGTGVAGTTDSGASVNAAVAVAGTVLVPGSTLVAGTVVEGTAPAPAIAPEPPAPATHAGTATETTPPAAQGAQATSPVLTAAQPASPGVDDTALADAPAGDGVLLDTAAPATTSTEPIVSPAPAALSPSALPTSMQDSSAPETAAATPDAGSPVPQPTAAPGPVAGTPAPNGTRGEVPGVTTAPLTAANGQDDLPTVTASNPAASHPAEAPTSVRAPALAGSQPAAAEPAAQAPASVVSAPIATAPAAPTAAPSTPAPAAPPAPAPSLNTQLAQPLFSLAGARPGEHVMTVQVTPENLGPVTVRAVITADDIRIELFSPSDGGRDALRQILTDLRRDLAGGGLSASLDLSSKDAQDSRHERAPLRDPPRDHAAVTAPVPEQRSTHSATATSTLDITV